MGRHGKDKPRLRGDRSTRARVQNNAVTTKKRIGGVTGKGFLPGRSGNPGSRPRLRPISERYSRVADLELPTRWRKRLGLWQGATWADAGVLGLFQAMAKGNPAAAKEIREAIEGKSTQRVELPAEGGGPIKLSLEATTQRIREIYGLAPRSESSSVQ
jgi:hypothetical protein